ncbi:MAG: succinylglutamate desuccinylase/aspartoacylase family protein [Thermomicrobiales bacterium]
MLRVGSVEAASGTRVYGSLDVGSLADGSPVTIPVALVNGSNEGRRLFVQAAVHGIEVNPLESLRRVITDIDPAELSGQIVAIIVANPLGFRNHDRRNTTDQEDVNRVWPGKADGRLSERIAHTIFEEAVRGSDIVVDLHTGYSTMITHTVFGEGDPGSEELARCFGTEYLIMEEKDDDWERARFSGKLRNVAAAEGIPAVTPELGGFSKFEGSQIQSGVIGLMNVLVRYGFLRGDVISPGRQIIIRNHLTRVTAENGGIFVPTVRPGQEVWETQELGYIYSPRNFEIVETVRAPFDSVVVFHAENPVVNTGDTLVNLGKRGR